MKRYLKSVLALSVISAFSLSGHAATYKIEPIATLDNHEYSYGQKQLGEGQEYIVSATESYNFPVLFEFLTLEDISNIFQLSYQAEFATFGLKAIEDAEAFLKSVQNREPSGNDLAWIIRYLENQALSLSHQKIGDVSAFYQNGTINEQFTVWDENFSTQFPELTRSTEDYLSGVNNLGWYYGSGSAPSLPRPYVKPVDIDTNGDGVNDTTIITQPTLWLSEFENKAFISVDGGTTIQPVEAPLNLYGGISAILDMSEVEGQYVAVGYASIGYNSTVIEFIESTSGCNNAANHFYEQQACIETARSQLYYLNAYKWIFDDAGNVIEQEILGQLITPHVDDERLHGSYAEAINRQGVAVGYSSGWRDENETSPAVNEPVNDYAVIFKEGKVIDVTPIHSDYLTSKLVDINENGIATGHVIELVNGVYRSKFFYVDVNNADLENIFPDGFFKGSSSKAHSINDNGFIVGEGEIERHNNGGEFNSQILDPRRRNAFLYDINTETFTNLNDFLECNTGYEIIEAQHINNNNEITATALKQVPRRDAKGELELDENGETLFEDIIQAVKLTPIDGEIVNCDSEEGELIERKGASFGFSLLGLLLLVFKRRR